MAPSITTGKKRGEYVVADIRQQYIEALGLSDDGLLDYVLPDGTIIKMPHPLFRPKAMKKRLKEFTKLAPEDQDEDDLAEILVGDEYEAFVTHDGDTDDLQLVLARIQRDTTDAVNGRPTRS